MESKQDDRSRQQSNRSREMQRGSDMRGSMGTPGSMNDRSESSQEKVRGSSSESERPQRQPGRMPLPD